MGPEATIKKRLSHFSNYFLLSFHPSWSRLKEAYTCYVLVMTKYTARQHWDLASDIVRVYSHSYFDGDRWMEGVTQMELRLLEVRVSLAVNFTYTVQYFD